MHDHSHCNHSHSTEIGFVDGINAEIFQTVHSNNSKDINENQYNSSSINKKWMYVIPVYLILGLKIYFNFTVKSN